MTVTLDDVQMLVDQLSPLDQARLIDYLSHRQASRHAETTNAPTIAQPSDALAKLAQLRTELATLPAERLASEQLARDRADRQATLEGTSCLHP